MAEKISRSTAEAYSGLAIAIFVVVFPDCFGASGVPVLTPGLASPAPTRE